MAINDYRDLRVWQVGMDLVVAVYGVTRRFPPHEQYGLAAQLQRSMVSVPSNIAEGHTREHLGEYLNHLSIARALLAEAATQLEIARRLDYLSQDEATKLDDQIRALGRQLLALRNALRRKQDH
jgi:four helix bundle protein